MIKLYSHALNSNAQQRLSKILTYLDSNVVCNVTVLVYKQFESLSIVFFTFFSILLNLSIDMLAREMTSLSLYCTKQQLISQLTIKFSLAHEQLLGKLATPMLCISFFQQKSRSCCAVYGCHNTRANNSDVSFHK